MLVSSWTMACRTSLMMPKLLSRMQLSECELHHSKFSDDLWFVHSMTSVQIHWNKVFVVLIHSQCSYQSRRSCQFKNLRECSYTLLALLIGFSTLGTCIVITFTWFGVHLLPSIHDQNDYGLWMKGQNDAMFAWCLADDDAKQYGWHGRCLGERFHCYLLGVYIPVKKHTHIFRVTIMNLAEKLKANWGSLWYSHRHTLPEPLNESVSHNYMTSLCKSVHQFCPHIMVWQ